jgi:hypothetical protein
MPSIPRFPPIPVPWAEIHRGTPECHRCISSFADFDARSALAYNREQFLSKRVEEDAAWERNQPKKTRAKVKVMKRSLLFAALLGVMVLGQGCAALCCGPKRVEILPGYDPHEGKGKVAIYRANF